MPTVQSLKKDIDSLKRNQDKLIKRISAIEKSHVPAVREEGEPKKRESATPVGGIILIVIGGLLSLTYIGAIIGIPLLIWGIVLVSRSSKRTTSKVKTKK